ncbi:uncharacterized protein BX663DRAFT_464308 [Cokeromyces recurvatus]|uniref:uncharacterized protein n=1 Tax=Cokeromyces recurvatus TaxID=90255 RepID=UPI00221EE791|nr:uncharacterized protein BX663DRAFT_464308 [Cokeromyces recurvatus]KAI7907884.1 hypothetical protein BX663DRAFT_464308 [Cokeromyces recurvatus]
MHHINNDNGYYLQQYDLNPKPVVTANDNGYTTKYTEQDAYSRIHNNENKSCCDKLCCGCCGCCPRWYRWLSCCFVLLVIVLGIIVGVLIGLFKKPSVEFTGIQDNPKFNLTGTNANLNLMLGFIVNNPNIASVTFKTLAATANYHGDNTQIGGGTLSDLHIGSNSITTISFPFDISLNLLSQETQTIAAKIISDCGIGGGTAKDIQLDYNVIATVSILGVAISIPYSNTVSFKCPIDLLDQSTILNNIETLLQTFLGRSTLKNNLVGTAGNHAALVLNSASI